LWWLEVVVVVDCVEVVLAQEGLGLQLLLL
jgi:hypothetical protein